MTRPTTLMRPSFCVAIVALLLCAATAEAGIRCSSGPMSHQCPDAVPVCCFAYGGTSAGCCPSGMTCAEGTNECQSAPSLAPGESSIPLHDVDSDFHVSKPIFIVLILFIPVILIFAGLLFACLSYIVDKYREYKRLKEALAQTPAEDIDDAEVTVEDEKSYRQALLQKKEQERRNPKSAERALNNNSNHQTPRESANAAPSTDEAERRVDREGTVEDTNDAINHTDEDIEQPNPNAQAVPAKCHLCDFAAVNCIFLDCSHSVMCLDCAQHTRLCPICRKKIRQRKRIFVVAG